MSSTSTTPRSRLTIPLCQRIALFACRGPQEAFLLAATNELFRETMIDYNTMHTVFCRQFWREIHRNYDCSAFEFVWRVAEKDVKWITSILISTVYYSYNEMKEESHRQKVTPNNTELALAVYKLVGAALRNNHADLTVELLKAFKTTSFQLSMTKNVFGFMCKILVMDACFNCCDGALIKELRTWNVVNWLIPILRHTDAEGHTALELACLMHSTAPNAVEFFTELLTFDESSVAVLIRDRRMFDSLSAALTSICDSTDQPALVKLFDRLLMQILNDKDNAALSRIWKGMSTSNTYSQGPRGVEFPLSAAAANCHHRVLLSVMSCIRNLSHSNIGDVHLPVELYAKTDRGFTPFLKAVSNGLIKNVKILVAQCESKEEYQEKWLSRMVDMKGQNAIALCGDANEDLKDFLLQEDCWEVSRRFYAQETGKLSEMKKESGARRQRGEEEAE